MESQLPWPLYALFAQLKANIKTFKDSSELRVIKCNKTHIRKFANPNITKRRPRLWNDNWTRKVKPSICDELTTGDNFTIFTPYPLGVELHVRTLDSKNSVAKMLFEFLPALNLVTVRT